MNYPELKRKDGMLENCKENIDLMLNYLITNHELNFKQGAMKKIELLYMTGGLSDEKFRELYGHYSWVKQGKPKRVKR